MDGEGGFESCRWTQLLVFQIVKTPDGNQESGGYICSLLEDDLDAELCCEKQLSLCVWDNGYGGAFGGITPGR